MWADFPLNTPKKNNWFSRVFFDNVRGVRDLNLERGTSNHTKSYDGEYILLFDICASFFKFPTQSGKREVKEASLCMYIQYCTASAQKLN